MPRVGVIRCKAFGIGDIRLTAYKWLFDVNVRRKGNIQVGLGIKFPTGNYHSEDYWYYSENPSVKSLQPLPEALQIGDGGTGITAAINAFYIFNRNISVFGNFFYLISPVNTNGVASFPAGVLPPSAGFIEYSNDKQRKQRSGCVYFKGGRELYF